MVSSLFGAAEQLLAEPRQTTDCADSGAMEFLNRQCPGRSRVFARLAAQSENLQNRASAHQRLCEIDPTTARQLAIRVLANEDDWLLCKAAATVLERLCANTGDIEIVRLLASVPEESRAAVAVAKALIAIGGSDAMVAARRLIPHLSMEAAATISEACSGVPREATVRQFVDAGIFTEPQFQRGIDQISRHAPPDFYYDPGDWSRAFLYGTGLFFRFDTEDDEIPPRYDELLQDFADHSGGVFSPAAVAQNCARYIPHKSEQLLVQFINGNRLYRFSPAANGDWIDVPSILDAVNLSLAHAGICQRFIPLRPEGQCIEFVFANPGSFCEVARTLGWAITNDAASAARQGIEFEEYVRRVLKFDRP